MAQTLMQIDFLIDDKIKEIAIQKLQKMGLNISDFFKITLNNFANENQQNFNELTIKTIQNSQQNIDVFSAKNADDLFNQLEI